MRVAGETGNYSLNKREFGTLSRWLTRRPLGHIVVASLVAVGSTATRCILGRQALARSCWTRHAVHRSALVACHPALATRCASFLARPLVRGPFDVSGPATPAGDLSLPVAIHRREPTIFFSQTSPPLVSRGERTLRRCATQVPHINGKLYPVNELGNVVGSPVRQACGSASIPGRRQVSSHARDEPSRLADRAVKSRQTGRDWPRAR